jgi:hypothetical protein
MKTVSLVIFDRNLAEELRHLASCSTANEIHLEETILAVGKTGRECEIEPAAGPDRRNPGFITLDRCHLAQAVGNNFAVEPGQTRPQREPGQHCADCQQQQRRGGKPFQPGNHRSYAGLVTSMIDIELVLPETPSRSPLVKITKSPISTRSRDRSDSKTLLYSIPRVSSVTSKATGNTPRYRLTRRLVETCGVNA